MGISKFCMVVHVLLVCHCVRELMAATSVDPAVMKRLERVEKVNVVVSFKSGVKSTLDSVAALRSGNEDLQSRNKAVVDALEQNAEECQAGVVDALLLSTRSGGGGGAGFKYFKKYWTSNTLFIKEATKATVEAIAENSNVSKIQLEPIFKLAPLNPITTKDSSSTTAADSSNGPGTAKLRREPGEPEWPKWPWNLMVIQAPEAWEELGGNQGEGVVVGVIDSGVRHTHERIRHAYRGDYGWMDPVDSSLEPNDNHGHGTAVTGIIVGTGIEDKGEIGVAPAAKYMVCRACTPEGDCTFEYVSDCVKFMACPSLPDGSNPDCTKAPRVINFSIADEHGSEMHKDDFLVLREVGIIPVAAIGNSGPACKTTEPPAELPFVIGVGGTGRDEVSNEYGRETLYGKSSFGPAYDGGIKPDLVAPGLNVIVAFGESDKDYLIGQGTSYASPHVAGVVALLLARQPDLSYDQVYEFLTLNTDHTNITTIPIPDLCPDQSIDHFPNNFLGFGRLNALKTVQAQTKALNAASNRR